MADSSENGYHGEYIGTTGSSPELSGSALQLNGDGGRASIPHDGRLALTGTDFTVCFWIQFDQVTAPADIVYKRDADDGWGFAVSSGGNISFVAGGTGGAETVDTTGQAAAGPWYHVCATFDAGTREATVYLDGQPSGPETFSNDIGDSGTALVIGADDSGATPHDGLFDDLKMWARKLTGGEIQAEYDALCAGGSCNTKR
jgi:hypothetical protein